MDSTAQAMEAEVVESVAGPARHIENVLRFFANDRAGVPSQYMGTFAGARRYKCAAMNELY